MVLKKNTQVGKNNFKLIYLVFLFYFCLVLNSNAKSNLEGAFIDIKILDKKNIECARGLSSFTSDEIIKIMGHHSNQIEKLLGYVSKSEVIHKDDMVEV